MVLIEKYVNLLWIIKTVKKKIFVYFMQVDIFFLERLNKQMWHSNC